MLAIGISGVVAQNRVKKSTTTKSVQNTQKVQEEPTVVVPKTKLEKADSLYSCYEGLLFQGAACDSIKLYKSLNESFAGYLDVLKDSTATASYIEVKKKLRGMYTKLCEGGIYSSQKRNVTLAVDLLEKYIMLPKNQFFKDEMFSFPPNIADLIYFVATSKYNTRDFATAITLFNEYLNTRNNEKHEQKVYLYLAKCYGYTGHDDYELYTLMKGVQKYPKDEKLHKEIIEHHIKTRNASQVDYHMMTYERVNTNRLELLEIKAKVAELKEDFYQFLVLSEQFYNAKSNDIGAIAMRGRSCYNYVIDEMKKGRTDAVGNPASDLIPHLDNAAKMFEMAVVKQPKDKQYYDALIDTYSLLGRKEDAVAVAEKLKVLLGITDDSLLAKKESSANQPKEVMKEKPKVEPQALAGNGELPKMTSYGAPVFSSFALDYANEKFAVWLKKDTYETTAAYNERTSDVKRKEKLRELANEAKHKYVNQYKNYVVNMTRGEGNGFSLVDYDADNETYLIRSALGNMLIRVPLKDHQAQIFMQQWSQGGVHTTNPLYDVVADTVCLTGVTFYLPSSGLSYDYSINNQLSYAHADIKIDPTPITGFDMMSMFSKNTKQIGGQKIFESEIDMADDGKKSDVDIDIPVIPDSLRNEKMFALIISNENYDLADQVQYAINDGTSVKEYCEKVLGIPSKQITHVVNADNLQMDRVIKSFAKLLRLEGAEAKGFVYYSGHGVSNMQTAEAFFLPVNADPRDLTGAISIKDFYNVLGSTGASRVDVYLDCCYSGTSRTGQMLVSARGTVIKPRESAPQGNMIVLSACSGDQTASFYSEKRHGLFTYYLLKKLKETSGNVTMGELADFIKLEVDKRSEIEHKKAQTPNVMTSGGLAATWQSMKVR